MTESILEEAQRLIHGQRNVAYGHPRDNFAAIAAQWNAYLNHMGDRELNSLDVANLMVLMKVARVVNGVYHRDSYTDMAGYAGTGERLQEPVEETLAEACDRLGDDAPFTRRDLNFSIKIGGNGPGDVVDPEVVPREWKSLADVPKNVRVRDKGGAVWKWHTPSTNPGVREPGEWLWGSDGKTIRTEMVRSAPFVEVLEEYQLDD